MEFRGVMTAITTPFNDDLTVDHDFLARHASWLVEHGCTGIVPLGSLGEGNTLQFDEKLAIVETCVAALDGRAPVMPGISALSTAEAVRIARGSAERGAEALMVLPPYVHNGKMHETRGSRRGHLRGHRPAVHALQQPVRLRGRTSCPRSWANWPPSTPACGRSRSRAATSGGSPRSRPCWETASTSSPASTTCPTKPRGSGATGWIAGLVNALPAESVRLFDLAMAGRRQEAFELYAWVPSPPAHGHRAGVRPVDQAGSGGGRDGLRDRAATPASPARGRPPRGAGVDPGTLATRPCPKP